ncbi:MAG: glycosyltransferase [Ferruginibacter sp.]
MKLLRIIPSMNPASGGPCQGIRNIIPALQKLGIQNEVVCLDPPDAEFAGKDLFTVHCLGPTKTPWQYSSQLYPWLLKNLERFDIVILHGLWLYHGYALYKAIKKLKDINALSGKKIPEYYVMPHGMLDPYFQKAGERKIKALRNVLYWKLIEHKLINNAAGILFTCEAEKILALQTFGNYHPKKEIDIGYGIQNPPIFDISMKRAFDDKCPQIKNESFILFLSRVHEKKGIDHLFDAIENLCGENNPHLELRTAATIKFVIAGPGLDDDYGKKLKERVSASSCLKSRVFFTGMLSGNSKWGAFYGCEAFILPSHQENFGIAIVEALSCCKPVLISNKVNIYNEIQQYNAGLVAEDTTEGAEKLLILWNNLSHEEKIQMSQNATECFKNQFTIQKAADRFDQLIIRKSEHEMSTVVK